MNFLDIILVIILSFCVIMGVFRGLIKELSSIIGVLGGFYAAYSYYMVLAKPLSRWISNTAYLNIISFLIIFCGILILIGILGVVIKYILKIAFLGWVDRICGAGFGIIKGILIASVLLITLTAFLPKNAPVVRDSLLAPYVTLISEKMAKVISRDMKHDFTAKIAELRKAWKQKI
ncbi:MAG: CvpA family protein [Pseudomonadota bacterium]|uniref:CvpA family protein n=1 Tax=Candidatus Desulfatibia profunda TaxID=2841695 RepID=A0A8J6NU93_9BACT|nr:CvpA family protein [Candidatus Desulfatibia profunda]MBL7179419.1 CvpA family protein [Desulfobacterales bacterium]